MFLKTIIHDPFRLTFNTFPFVCSFLISMDFSPIKRGNFFERPKMATRNNTVDILVKLY